MAKRLDWEKEAKRLKLIKQGFQPLWEDLLTPTGSRAQNRAVAKQLRKLEKKKKQTQALQMPPRKVARSSKVRVFRRREGEGIIPVGKNVKR